MPKPMTEQTRTCEFRITPIRGVVCLTVLDEEDGRAWEWELSPEDAIWLGNVLLRAAGIAERAKRQQGGE